MPDLPSLRALRRALRCGLLPLLAAVLVLPLAAQSGGSGTIRGRVFNDATHEYVRNAEVRVEGTSITALSEEGGSYQLANVPAGTATLDVSYTGMQDAKLVVEVMPGQTAAADFHLQELGYNGSGGDKVIQMEKLEIGASRSGEAKAVMERRAATNAQNVVASDNYGNLTMGDVGEFLKSMPGLSLDYVEVDTSAVRIGGLDPKYSTFTTDGARMPTATSNNNTGRQNSFEQMSITGIESIEFNNTLLARMDADAPGGSINLVSKYAFEGTGRHIDFQVGAIGTSDAKFVSQYFPDDQKHERIRPSTQLGYSDIFLDGKLGVAFNASYNANFVEQDRNQIDYLYLAGGRVIPYEIMFRPGPKMTERTAANLAVDYKLSDRLVLSLRNTFSNYDVEYVNQYTYMHFGSNSGAGTSYATPTSTGTDIVVTPNGTNSRVDTEYSHRYAKTPVLLFNPKLEYKGDTWTATVRGSYSQAKYDFRDTMEGFFQRTDSGITGIGFEASRPAESSYDWTLTQTSGPSWSDPTNWKSYGSPNIRQDNTDTKSELYNGNLDLKKQLTVADIPVTLYGGGSIRTNSWNTDEGSYNAWTFVGPTGVQANAVVPYTQNYKFQITGFNPGNLNAQNWRADSNYATWQLYQQHPEYFTPENAVTNLTRKFTNTRGIEEQINAAYVEAQARYQRARFDFGIRNEGTEENSKVWDIKTLAQVKAAGYAVSTTAPTTTDGLIYQYNNGRQTRHRSTYDNWFLSGGAKYDITPNLVAQAAFSDSILRADYGNLSGATTVNDSALTVTVPNVELKPEKATKYYAGLQYFLEPSGVLGMSFYRLRIKDMQETGITVDPTAAGYSATDYPGYTYISTINDPTVHYTNGITWEYNQQMTFLPGALKGLGLYGSLTRVIADSTRVGTPNKTANWGFKYRYGPFVVQLNGTWNSDSRVSALSNTPTTANNGVLYHASRVIWGASAGYKISRHLEFMLAGRNIFNSPDIQYSDVRTRLQLYSIYGSLWTAAVKGSF